MTTSGGVERVNVQLSYNCPKHGIDASCTCADSGYAEAKLKHEQDMKLLQFPEAIALLQKFVDHFLAKQGSPYAAKAQYEMLKHMPEIWVTIESAQTILHEVARG